MNENKDNQQKVTIPISIAINNVKSQISNIVNTCGLPISVLELIMKDLYDQTSNVARQQLEHDEIEYTKSLQQNNDNNEESVSGN